MVNEELLGGLKSALERGQSLRDAMLSLFNAGYNRAEIEEAARTLNEAPRPMENKIALAPTATPAPPKEYPKSAINNQPLIPAFKKLIPEEKKNNSVDKISDYKDKPHKNNLLIILIVCALVAISGIIILLFVFRKDLINFFSSLFS